jgi:hypothetical protein
MILVFKFDFVVKVTKINLLKNMICPEIVKMEKSYLLIEMILLEVR